MHIRVKVKTSAKKESLRKTGEQSFVISVKEKAKDNAANRRILALVAEHFNIRVQQVRIISGHHYPSKLLSVA